jgi:hypothetical protein
MKEVYLIRTIHGLQGADDASEAAIRSFGIGNTIKAKLTLARNLDFHRKVMALIHIAFENQDKYNDFDIFLDVIKILAGHVVFIPGPDNTKIAVTKSISFGKMDELEFREFYKKVFEVVVTKIMVGVDRGELDKEVLMRVRNFMGKESLAEKEYNERLVNG